MGFLVGRVLGFLIFHSSKKGLSRVGDGLVSLAATFLAYALTELMHGYGFLAVFICALTIRAWERNHDFHDEMHHFSDLIERLLMMLVLVLFGGALARGLLDALTWTDMGIGLVVLLVVRPVAGLVAMIGSPHPMRERALLAFLGIRGLGTVYYIAYGKPRRLRRQRAPVGHRRLHHRRLDRHPRHQRQSVADPSGATATAGTHTAGVAASKAARGHSVHDDVR